MADMLKRGPQVVVGATGKKPVKYVPPGSTAQPLAAKKKPLKRKAPPKPKPPPSMTAGGTPPPKKTPPKVATMQDASSPAAAQKKPAAALKKKAGTTGSPKGIKKPVQSAQKLGITPPPLNKPKAPPTALSKPKSPAALLTVPQAKTKSGGLTPPSLKKPAAPSVTTPSLTKPGGVGSLKPAAKKPVAIQPGASPTKKAAASPLKKPATSPTKQPAASPLKKPAASSLKKPAAPAVTTPTAAKAKSSAGASQSPQQAKPANVTPAAAKQPSHAATFGSNAQNATTPSTPSPSATAQPALPKPSKIASTPRKSYTSPGAALKKSKGSSPATSAARSSFTSAGAALKKPKVGTASPTAAAKASRTAVPATTKPAIAPSGTAANAPAVSPRSSPSATSSAPKQSPSPDVRKPASSASPRQSFTSAGAALKKPKAATSKGATAKAATTKAAPASSPKPAATPAANPVSPAASKHAKKPSPPATSVPHSAGEPATTTPKPVAGVSSSPSQTSDSIPSTKKPSSAPSSVKPSSAPSSVKPSLNSPKTKPLLRSSPSSSPPKSQPAPKTTLPKPKVPEAGKPKLSKTSSKISSPKSSTAAPSRTSAALAPSASPPPLSPPKVSAKTASPPASSPPNLEKTATLPSSAPPTTAPIALTTPAANSVNQGDASLSAVKRSPHKLLAPSIGAKPMLPTTAASSNGGASQAKPQPSMPQTAPPTPNGDIKVSLKPFAETGNGSSASARPTPSKLNRLLASKSDAGAYQPGKRLAPPVATSTSPSRSTLDPTSLLHRRISNLARRASTGTESIDTADAAASIAQKDQKRRSSVDSASAHTQLSSASNERSSEPSQSLAHAPPPVPTVPRIRGPVPAATVPTASTMTAPATTAPATTPPAATASAATTAVVALPSSNGSKPAKPPLKQPAPRTIAPLLQQVGAPKGPFQPRPPSSTPPLPESKVEGKEAPIDSPSSTPQSSPTSIESSSSAFRRRIANTAEETPFPAPANESKQLSRSRSPSSPSETAASSTPTPQLKNQPTESHAARVPPPAPVRTDEEMESRGSAASYRRVSGGSTQSKPNKEHMAATNEASSNLTTPASSEVPPPASRNNTTEPQNDTGAASSAARDPRDRSRRLSLPLTSNHERKPSPHFTGLPWRTSERSVSVAFGRPSTSATPVSMRDLRSVKQRLDDALQRLDQRASTQRPSKRYLPSPSALKPAARSSTLLAEPRPSSTPIEHGSSLSPPRFSNQAEARPSPSAALLKPSSASEEEDQKSLATEIWDIYTGNARKWSTTPSTKVSTPPEGNQRHTPNGPSPYLRSRLRSSVSSSRPLPPDTPPPPHALTAHRSGSATASTSRSASRNRAGSMGAQSLASATGTQRSASLPPRSASVHSPAHSSYRDDNSPLSLNEEDASQPASQVTGFPFPRQTLDFAPAATTESPAQGDIAASRRFTAHKELPPPAAFLSSEARQGSLGTKEQRPASAPSPSPSPSPPSFPAFEEKEGPIGSHRRNEAPTTPAAQSLPKQDEGHFQHHGSVMAAHLEEDSWFNVSDDRGMFQPRSEHGQHSKLANRDESAAATHSASPLLDFDFAPPPTPAKKPATESLSHLEQQLKAIAMQQQRMRESFHESFTRYTGLEEAATARALKSGKQIFSVPYVVDRGVRQSIAVQARLAEFHEHAVQRERYAWRYRVEHARRYKESQQHSTREAIDKAVQEHLDGVSRQAEQSLEQRFNERLRYSVQLRDSIARLQATSQQLKEEYLRKTAAYEQLREDYGRQMLQRRKEQVKQKWVAAKLLHLPLGDDSTFAFSPRLPAEAARSMSAETAAAAPPSTSEVVVLDKPTHTAFRACKRLLSLQRYLEKCWEQYNTPLTERLQFLMSAERTALPAGDSISGWQALLRSLLAGASAGAEASEPATSLTEGVKESPPLPPGVQLRTEEEPQPVAPQSQPPDMPLSNTQPLYSSQVAAVHASAERRREPREWERLLMQHLNAKEAQQLDKHPQQDEEGLLGVPKAPMRDGTQAHFPVRNQREAYSSTIPMKFSSSDQAPSSPVPSFTDLLSGVFSKG